MEILSFFSDAWAPPEELASEKQIYLKSGIEDISYECTKTDRQTEALSAWISSYSILLNFILWLYVGNDSLFIYRVLMCYQPHFVLPSRKRLGFNVSDVWQINCNQTYLPSLSLFLYSQRESQRIPENPRESLHYKGITTSVSQSKRIKIITQNLKQMWCCNQLVLTPISTNQLIKWYNNDDNSSTKITIYNTLTVLQTST